MGQSSIQVGKVRITALNDGGAVFPMRVSQLFPHLPEAAWEPYRKRFPGIFAGPDVPWTEYNSYLVQSPARAVLVDTGIGPQKSVFLGEGGGHLMDELTAAGIRPEDINTVFFTHLHMDHIGWSVDGGRARFPKARYVVHRADWDQFNQPHVLASPFGTSIREQALPLEALGVLDLLEGDAPLTDEITAIETPGHTNGHMSLLVASAGEKALITGDAFGNPVQVTEPGWSEMFDTDAQMSAETRRALLDRIEAEGMTMAVGHGPGAGFGRVVRLEGRRYFQAV